MFFLIKLQVERAAIMQRPGALEQRNFYPKSFSNLKKNFLYSPKKRIFSNEKKMIFHPKKKFIIFTPKSQFYIQILPNERNNFSK